MNKSDLKNKRYFMLQIAGRDRLILICLFFALLEIFPFSKSFAGLAQDKTYIESDFYNGSKIRIDLLNEKTARIRIISEINNFSNSGLNRYKFINDSVAIRSRFEISKKGKKIIVKTNTLELIADVSDGSIVVLDENGKRRMDQISFQITKQNSTVFFRPVDKMEDWVGFGDQTRQRLYHRGYQAYCNVQNVKSYLPVPFFMSTHGLGILVNTTFPVVFDMCKSSSDKYLWETTNSNIDYYVMVGNDFKDLLNTYTGLTGKPELPPKYSFGLWYISPTQADAFRVVDDAERFRKEGIPLDVVGLEPGWMEKNYDISIDKQWNNTRFPMASYLAKSQTNFLQVLRRMGFRVELWLANDYDLSYEAERRIGNNINHSNLQDFDILSNNFKVEKDQHFEKGARRLDGITKPEIPWFDHLKKFIDQGASFFKQDGAYQVLTHPDRAWANGMSDMEMHNLYPLLYSKQMYDGIAGYTRERPVVFTVSGWAGFQAYCGTWTGDTGGGPENLTAIMNLSLVGGSWSTVDMDVQYKEGIHFGYLLPWAQINSWNYFRMPWYQGDELLTMHKFYSRFRSQLIPYLYSWSYQTTLNGVPLLRPLTLEFEKDKNCRDNYHQYLLGRDIMVSAFSDTTYFPKGEWKNYWDGQIVEGGVNKVVKAPKDKGGGFFIRSGAIIPMGPVMQYSDSKKLDSINLYIYPSEEKTSFSLFEDDGISFAYKTGEKVITEVTQEMADHTVKIIMNKPRGHLKRVIENKNWNVTVNSISRPISITVNGKELPADDWTFDSSRKEIRANIGRHDEATILVRYKRSI